MQKTENYIGETGLSSFLSETLLGSSIPDSIQESLHLRMVKYYLNHGIFKDTLGSAVAYVYENKLDSYHDIYLLPEESYLVIPALKAFPKDVLLDTLKTYKNAGVNLSSDEGQRLIQGATAGAKLIHAGLLECRKSSRRFIDTKPVPEFPDFETLKKFHECKRKPKHGTRDEAEKLLHKGQVSYRCSYCSLWHNGHPSKLNDVSREAMETRYKRTWRRYKGI